MGGFRYVNGFPGEAPVRPNLSIGDTLAGLHAALGILLAYIRRQAGGSGQVVDCAILDSVFNLLEGVVPEYDGAGVIREPSGSTLTGIVPTNTYRCSDGKFVVIGGNGDSIFKRFMQCMGRTDLAEDPRLASNAGRVEHEPELDEAIALWTSSMTSTQALALLEEASVPAGPIYSVADMFEDPHFNARGLFQQVEIDGEPLKIPAIPPILSETPGATFTPGPTLGSHNDQIFTGVLGLTVTEMDELSSAGII